MIGSGREAPAIFPRLSLTLQMIAVLPCQTA